MAGIGFRTKAIADKELPVIYNDKKAKAKNEIDDLETQATLEAIMKQRGFDLACEVIKEFLQNTGEFYSIRGGSEKLKLNEKLDFIKIKYFTSF